jgi:hypothetical protein
LLKIELDPRKKLIFGNFFGPNTPFPIDNTCYLENKFFLAESERETDKAEGFADDANAITIADQESISAIEDILLNFEKISGLVCNFSKSSITFFGDVTNSGGLSTKFVRTNEFSILGVTIDGKLERLANSFAKTKKKMQEIVNFWSRFNLSLKGRIGIAKCFLLSQVNYFGCIYMPSNDDLQWMQGLTDNFCTGSLRISKDKLYLSAENGGLGLINLTHALMAQQINWFKRAAKSTRDNWRYDLLLCGSGNCLTPDPEKLDPEKNPILFRLVESYGNFAKIFYKTDNNFLESFILNNPCISVNEGYAYNINTKFWLYNGNTNLYNLSKIRVTDLLTDYKLKPFVVLNTTYNLNLSFTTYIRLSGILSKALPALCRKTSNSLASKRGQTPPTGI